MENTIQAINNQLSGASPATVREGIACLTAGLLAHPEIQVQFEVKHSFAKGMYIREMFIPKGHVIVGKIHKKECINICSKGDITITTESGEMRVVAPYTIVSPPGLQRVGVTHEDTVWINIFLTDETDIDKLENELVFSDEDAINILDPEHEFFKNERLVWQSPG